MSSIFRTFTPMHLRSLMAALALWLGATGLVHGQIKLADQPVFSSNSVPGNVVLALSVEFPTAVSVAHQGKFVPGTRYLGYFDYAKCYRYYVGTETGDDLSHFYPVSTATRSYKCTDDKFTDTWSGNFLNWLTMQAIDPFRWALTGGLRVVDTATTTILERAWATSDSNNGSDSNFPIIPTSNSDPLKERPSPSSSEIEDHTPLSFSSLKVSVRKRGNQVWFTKSASLSSSTTGTPTHYDQTLSSLDADTRYYFYARVKVCESGTGFSVEANCVAYASGGYKPEGLMQQYASKIRYSAFGYLNDPTDNIRDGGVLRAKQKFIGPTYPVPGSTDLTNTESEWDETTGVLAKNPNSADASDTASWLGITINNSGVINYVNKFGQEQKTYKRRDPVSELYYAALRYLKNQGSVTTWYDIAEETNKERLADGFPVIRSWDDPVQYSCQKHFILGIGDTNTNWDRNVPGSGGGSNEPTMPKQVTDDTTVDAVEATNKVGVMEGLGTSLGSTVSGNASYLIAGLAYAAHTRDIRPDDNADTKTLGKQTVSTYWLDVLEFGNYVANNQYYLAAKYGGFAVPTDFSYDSRTEALPSSWWDTNSDTVGGQSRPDNYYTVAKPDQMVAGLKAAFSSISSSLRAFTTSFATTLPQVSLTGTASYGAQYDAATWTGDVTGSSVVFDATTVVPTLTTQWSFASKLASQAAGTGWDTGRRIATWNTYSNSGVAFRYSNLSDGQKTALDTVYRSGDDGSDYLNYLRGDQTNEESSSASDSAHIYRNRTSLVGDIVGSRVLPVGKPAAPYSNAANPGYSTFKSDWSSRKTMVYVGTNAGMLHAIDGSLTGTTAGQEVFAYVPGPLYLGPNNTPGVDGLAARGDPDFTHKPMVDASPVVYDIDLARTMNDARTGLFATDPNWKSVLVGSLGKGGKSYFAIDVTDPSAMSTESAVAGKVLWEFSHSDLGYTYGTPLSVKTRKWGWVLVFGSGYNNTDGKGYFFFVNPRTGALLEKVGTDAGSTSSPAGLAHVQAYVLDRTDGTAEAIYAGDLLGNLWRLDVTPSAGNYAAPLKLAQLRNANNQALPVTSRPLVVVHPSTGRRFVTVGTGRLLHSSDVLSAQKQIFAAIADGTGTAMGKSTTLPSGVTYPIQMSNLVESTDLTTPLSIDFTKKVGWWTDMGRDSNNLAWRVTSDPSSYYGQVSWISMVPNGNACSPSGKSRIYSVDVATAESVLIEETKDTGGLVTTTNVVAFVASTDGIFIDQQTLSVGGVPNLYAGNDKGGVEKVNRKSSSSLGLRRLNWRELQVAD